MNKQAVVRGRVTNLTLIWLGALFLSVDIFSNHLDLYFNTGYIHNVCEATSFVCLSICLIWYTIHFHRLQQVVDRSLVIQDELRQTSIVASRAAKELENYLDLAPCAWITLDTSGIISHVNNKATHLFGYSKDELNGKSLEILHPSYFLGSLNNLIAAANRLEYNDAQKQNPEVEVQSKGGETHYVDLDVGMFEHENKGIITCVVRDTSSAVNLKKQLKESEQNLLAILENSAEQLFSVNREHELTLFNNTFSQEFEKLTGQKPSEGIIHYSIAYPHLRSVWFEAIEKSLDGFSQRFEANYKVNEEQKCVLVNLRPIERDAKVVGVSCSVNDVSELKNYQNKLQMSLERYELVTRATSEIIWDWDIQEGSMHWGQNLERILGYTTKSEQSGTGLLANRLHEDDRLRVLNGVYSALLDPRREYWEDEYRYRRLDGRYAVISDKACIVRDANGNAKNMVGSMDDVTEKRRAELVMSKFNQQLKSEVAERTSELAEALSKEQHLSELKTRFMSTVSHEFRTPLTVILSSTDLLSRYSERMNGDQKKSHYVMIQSEVNRLVTMLNEILALGRTAAGKTVINSEKVSLHSFFDSMQSRMSSVDSGLHTICVQNSWPFDNAVFDESLMSHVMSNLITNAIKYSPEGSRIDVVVRNEAQNLIISVRDQGIGIPEADLQSLFKPFHRAANVGSIQGTGLGLAITRDYVELHGGTVEAMSIENKGTTITINLPQPVQIFEEGICNPQS